MFISISAALEAQSIKFPLKSIPRPRLDISRAFDSLLFKIAPVSASGILSTNMEGSFNRPFLQMSRIVSRCHPPRNEAAMKPFSKAKTYLLSYSELAMFE